MENAYSYMYMHTNMGKNQKIELFVSY